MLDVLLLIPHELGGLPVFGWGWALGVWLVVVTVVSIVQGRRCGWGPETWGSAPLFLAIGAAIVFVLPRMEEFDPATEAWIGLPIRGFGVMVTLGVMSGVGLSAYAARRAGLDQEHIYSLAFWMFLFGIIGARTFYVVQNWSEYQRETLGATLLEVVKFTQGGLVVYGALIGALAAGGWYLRSRRLPVLAIGDLIAPGMLVGLAWGRIGCFLHGCCFGGVCAIAPLGVSFPATSPPYEHQQAEGRFHGMQLRRDDAAGVWRVTAVDDSSEAAERGVRPGDRIVEINGRRLEEFAGRRIPARLLGPRLGLKFEDGREAAWSLPEMPARSRPVHPVQLYSSVHAALLALLLWAIYPYARRDGEVFAWMLTLYPIGRIFEELVRDDEPGRFGTALTISQWVSVGLLAGAAVLWAVVLRRPAVRALAGGNYSNSSDATV